MRLFTGFLRLPAPRLLSLHERGLVPAAVSAILAFTVLLLPFAGPAEGGLIAGQDIIPAPASVVDDPPGAVNTAQQAFNERQNVLLTANVTCDGGVVIPAGTLVSSHMIFLNTFDNSTAIDLGVMWQFDGPVLGVMSDINGTLEAASTPSLGAPGTAYPAAYANRGIETADGYLVAGDFITVDMTVSEPGDWIRVVTKAAQIRKWVQPPDLSMFGIDVEATSDYLLADDFLCSETGPITEIHVFGSWLYDRYPSQPVPDNVTFTLSFHTDIPWWQSPTDYSMPGELLWLKTFHPGEFEVVEYADHLMEGWMTPPDHYMFPADSTCWLYIFRVDETEAFIQQGDPAGGTVYWLDVQAVPADTTTVFGWKTSEQHWNDDAVWGFGPEPYFGPWGELRYPPQHEMQGQSIDLAFALHSPPELVELDFGDAPDPSYPTLLANNGARHVIDPTIYMGLTVDGDPDGQPDPNSLGDDSDGLDDENGLVYISNQKPGQTGRVDIQVSADGHLDGWIDFHADGSWAEMSDRIAADVVAAGVHTVYYTIPADAVPGMTHARFRFNTMTNIGYDGPATDGEVEDYEVEILRPSIVKWEQVPDLTPMGIDVNASREYLLADDFLCNSPGLINQVHIWGSWLYDYLPQQDPDSVRFTLSLHRDIPADQSPTGYSMPGELLWLKIFRPGEFTSMPVATSILEGWMDPPEQYFFPADSTCWRYDFEIDPSEAFHQEGTEDNPIVYWLDVKAVPFDQEATFGWKTTRDHWNDDAVWVQADEPYNGDWNELRYPPGHEMYGQSIDLAFRIFHEPDPVYYDYGDAIDPTYPTMLGNDGARHVVVPGVFMGAGVDVDPDGQPHPYAAGDDNDGFDDEDGVAFTVMLAPNLLSEVEVTVSVDGQLDAWIDFNIDGGWMEPQDLIYSGPVTAGLNTIPYVVPATADSGHTFARFRFNTGGPLALDGPAADGEVEDYYVTLHGVTAAPDGLTPKTFRLYQSMPNPFNHATRIRFDLPQPEQVKLTVFSVDGRQVATVVDERMPEGRHQAVWNGRDDTGKRTASGIYFYRLEAGAYRQTMKLILLK